MVVLLTITAYACINNEISDVGNTFSTYDQAVDSLYYLFWCKGQENIAQALNQFQIDFHLSDEDMDLLAETIGQYQADQSKLYYQEQHAVEALEIAALERGEVVKSSEKMDVQKGYHAKRQINHDLLSKEIQNYIDNQDIFAKWMAEFVKEDAQIRQDKAD